MSRKGADAVNKDKGLIFDSLSEAFQPSMLHHDLGSKEEEKGLSWSRDEFIAERRRDSEIAALKETALTEEEVQRESEGYYLNDWVSLRKWRPPTVLASEDSAMEHQVVVPKVYRAGILTVAHSMPLGGHFGVSKTVNRIRKEFYWPNLRKDFVKLCKTVVKALIKVFALIWSILGSRFRGPPPLSHSPDGRCLSLRSLLKRVGGGEQVDRYCLREKLIKFSALIGEARSRWSHWELARRIPSGLENKKHREMIEDGFSEWRHVTSGGITSRWSCPAPGSECKQDDDNQQPSVRIRMATGGKLNRVQKVLKRFLPDISSRKDDRDTGSKVPKQGQIESNVPMECGPAAEEEEQIQPRDSDVRDTEQDPGTGTSEATSCQLGSSLNTELSSAQQGVEFTISDLLAEGGEYQLYQLTKFYRDRLKHAIEEKVERLGWMLTKEGHFSREENEKVTELTEKGNRTESSRLFLSLVMGKGSRARRAMWESFVMWRTELPKLDRILREIQELGPDPEEYINIAQGLSELPTELTDVQQKHKETLRAQTETLRVNTILMREKVKVFQLVDRYTKLTVISTLRDRRLVEHELLARGRDHEDYREKHLRGALEKIQTAQLFHSSFSRSKSKSGSSAAVAGVPGIGKTTMVQKIVYDWAAGKIFQQFQFVFSFKFRDLNSINCRINLRELILDQYPYFGNILRDVWKNPKGLLFIFDGLDEFKHRIDFADSRRDTEPKHQCPDPEWWCEVSDIVYSLIQGKLLPGCSVLVTTRPTVLHLLEKAEINVCAEILGFVGEERKEYFIRYFEDQTVAEAVFKHLQENEILYTMSYNPSYCWILALALGPFFTQRVRDPQRVPKTITQLYSYYIYNILKNHCCEIENPRDVLLR
ncbi:uncharacterized protein, partial [Hemitrygon akajei]|uniref:uncharacterized protein n=1 Tax=Hemitrygon akajei TaxID=2704970 RepID=UPI003BF9E8C9